MHAILKKNLKNLIDNYFLYLFHICINIYQQKTVFMFQFNYYYFSSFVTVIFFLYQKKGKLKSKKAILKTISDHKI